MVCFDVVLLFTNIKKHASSPRKKMKGPSLADLRALFYKQPVQILYRNNQSTYFQSYNKFDKELAGISEGSPTS